MPFTIARKSNEKSQLDRLNLPNLVLRCYSFLDGVEEGVVSCFDDCEGVDLGFGRSLSVGIGLGGLYLSSILFFWEGIDFTSG